MTEIEFVEFIRELTGAPDVQDTSLRFAAELIRYIVRDDNTPSGDLSEAMADTIDAAAAGFDAIGDAVEGKAPSS